jgi:hypothetical protein
MSEIIENKVAKSGLITLDLEEMKPNWRIKGFDIEQALWQGLALKEKDFREFVKAHDWEAYANTEVHIYCSAEAIVPTWAYMLIATALQPIANRVIFGSKDDLKKALWRNWVSAINTVGYEDCRVIIKGCSKEQIDASIYVELTAKLTPVVKSLMYGEPCSTVPLYKKK